MFSLSSSQSRNNAQLWLLGGVFSHKKRLSANLKTDTAKVNGSSEFLHFIRAALWMSLHSAFQSYTCKDKWKPALRASKLFEGTICAIILRHGCLYQSCQWTHHNWMQKRFTHSLKLTKSVMWSRWTVSVVLVHFLLKPGNIYKIKQPTVSFFVTCDFKFNKI